MRLANVGGRLCVQTAEHRMVDLETASSGQLSATPRHVYDNWEQVVTFVSSLDSMDEHAQTSTDLGFGNPVPEPRQVFAIGLNYREHARETNQPIPEDISVFTKFPASLAAPYSDVRWPGGQVDWEAELVVVIGRHAYKVSVENAWAHVAGLTVGQDFSERKMQLSGQPPQFSLAKSYLGFGPLGPVLVTPDELDDPDDLEIECWLNSEQVQHSRTSDMIFPVAEIIARLSNVLPLLPGDVIFTGTPPGVGVGRTPPRFIQPGDEVETSISGIGSIRQRFVDGR